MTSPVIALLLNARYDRHKRVEARAMSNGTATEIEQRLNDGAWLKPGEVATLFGKSRWSVINWLKNGVKIGDERYHFGWRPTVGGHRILDPDDVTKALAASRAIQTRRTVKPAGPETPPTDS